jgi:hypothetical protein
VDHFPSGVLVYFPSGVPTILLIDFAKAAEEQGMARKAAIVEAGRVRLRPILMTTFALIAGMIPVAIGSGEGADFRAPPGRAVIGGVITSTVLTLLVIPTVYDIMSEWRDRAMGLLKRPAPAARRARREERVRGAEPGMARVTTGPEAQDPRGHRLSEPQPLFRFGVPLRRRRYRTERDSRHWRIALA